MPKTPTKRLAARTSRSNPFAAPAGVLRLDDPAIRAAMALDSTSFSTAPLDWWDAPIRKAFKAFDLDPANPFNWNVLLRHLCEAHFGDRARRGRAPKWRGEEGKQLVEAVDAIAAERGKGIRDAVRTAMSRHKKDHPDWNEKHSAHDLERRYYEAKRYLQHLEAARRAH